MSWFSEQADDAIRRGGGRVTAQRQLVITLLENTAGSLDAEGLYHLAHATDSSISIATVYRTLNVLEKARLVQQRYRSREHERRTYERLSAAPEYHFTCRACHKIIPFHTDLVREIEQQIATERGLVVFNACLCLDGLCLDCQTKANQNTRP